MLNKKKNIQFFIDEIKKNGENILLIDVITKKKTTYNQFLNKSIQFSNYLKEKKVKFGDKIIIKLENSSEYLISIFACLIGGYVACPIDLNIPPNKYKKLKKILKCKYEIDDLKKINYSENKNFSLDNRNPISLIIFTSGTTGEPKGIQLNREEYLGSAISFSKIAEYESDSKIYHCLPMHYNAGLLNTFLSGLVNGSEIILGTKVSMFNIINFWKELLDYKVNSFHIVPEIANALCKINVSYEEKVKIDKKEKIISTGSHLHEEIKDKFEKKYKKRILSCYGLTEIGGPISLENWEDTFEENSVGKIVDNVKIKIINKNNLSYVAVNTPYLFNSYLLNNGKKSKPKLVNKYFVTGDIGDFKNGNLYIFGRRKDIFKKGSEIISPQDIENVALKLKSVIDCCVIIKADVEKGSKIYLLIDFKNKEKTLSEINKIKKFLIKNLKKIEYPDKIIPVSKILKTSNGKIKKYDLEKLYL